jgi:hypothetical protein
MAYSKTTWAKRVRQYLQRFTLTATGNPNEYDISRVEGTISVVGTPFSITNMQKIEDAIEDIINGEHNYGASAAGSDTYAITFGTAFSSLPAGIFFNVKADVGNTGAATLTIDAIAAKDIKKMTAAGKAALATGDIIAGGIYTVLYDGTDFILSNPLAILASLGTAAGDIPYFSGANTPAKLALDGAYKVLGANSGNNGIQYWASLQSILTAKGDQLWASGANTPARIAKGSLGQFWRQLADDTPGWSAANITASGSFSESSQSINASSDLTYNIAVGLSATHGQVWFYHYHGGLTSYRSVMVMFTTSTSGALSFYCMSHNSTVRMYSGSSELSAPTFDSGGNTIYLKSARMNGTNLELVFHNNDASPTTLLIDAGTWEVYL